jgi:hypothetical protein
MFQSRSRQALGYVPGMIKAGSRVCSRQDQGRLHVMFQIGSRQVQVMFQAGSRQVPVYVPGRIKAYSEPIPDWLKPIPDWLEPIPGPRGGLTLFQADSHASSGTHTVPKCVHVHYCIAMYLPYSRLYSMFVFLDLTWRRG